MRPKSLCHDADITPFCKDPEQSAYAVPPSEPAHPSNEPNLICASGRFYVPPEVLRYIKQLEHGLREKTMTERKEPPGRQAAKGAREEMSDEKERTEEADVSQRMLQDIWVPLVELLAPLTEAQRSKLIRAALIILGQGSL